MIAEVRIDEPGLRLLSRSVVNADMGLVGQLEVDDSRGSTSDRLSPSRRA